MKKNGLSDMIHDICSKNYDKNDDMKEKILAPSEGGSIQREGG